MERKKCKLKDIERYKGRKRNKYGGIKYEDMMDYLSCTRNFKVVVKLKPDFRPEPGTGAEPKLCVSYLSYLLQQFKYTVFHKFTCIVHHLWVCYELTK